MRRNQHRRALQSGRATAQAAHVERLCRADTCCFGCMDLTGDGSVVRGDSRGHFACSPGRVTLEHLRAERLGWISRRLVEGGWEWVAA
jgi:hypothetical protein